MKITFDWLKDHLKTNLKEKNLLEQLTNIGLEVESVESPSDDNGLFKVAEIIKTEKHPNADRLKICDVNIGENEIKKVVCGAGNAKEGLLTIYAPPGAIIPKTKMKLVIAKIRDVTSYGMLCSESELNLSDESDGIIELSKGYKKNIGKSYFSKLKTTTSKVYDYSLGRSKSLPKKHLCLPIWYMLEEGISDKVIEDFEINVLGAIRTIKFVLQNLKNSPSASIVVFSSVVIKTGMPFHSSIGVSKGAIEA